MVHDPLGLSSGRDSTGNVVPGNPYLAVGTWGSTDLFYSVGAAATDAAASELLAESASAVPFDPAVEFLVTARSEPGMSGGGVFDSTGRYVGELVRGGASGEARTSYFRVVRASHLQESLRQALTELPDDESAAVGRFLMR